MKWNIFKKNKTDEKFNKNSIEIEKKVKLNTDIVNTISIGTTIISKIDILSAKISNNKEKSEEIILRVCPELNEIFKSLDEDNEKMTQLGIDFPFVEIRELYFNLSNSDISFNEKLKFITELKTRTRVYISYLNNYSKEVINEIILLQKEN